MRLIYEGKRGVRIRWSLKSSLYGGTDVGGTAANQPPPALVLGIGDRSKCRHAVRVDGGAAPFGIQLEQNRRPVDCFHNGSQLRDVHVHPVLQACRALYMVLHHGRHGATLEVVRCLGYFGRSFLDSFGQRYDQTTCHGTMAIDCNVRTRS